MKSVHSIKLRVRFKSQTQVIEISSSDSISIIKSKIRDIFNTLRFNLKYIFHVIFSHITSSVIVVKCH